MSDTEIIWESILDNQYTCKVERVDESTGCLVVRDNVNAFLILEQTVALSYGAMYGPDLGDVAHWQDLCIEAIDELGTS